MPEVPGPEPEPEPESAPEVPEPPETVPVTPKAPEAPKPAKKKKRVVIELDSDSDDETVSVRMPRNPPIARPSFADWRPRGQAGLTEAKTSWPSNWQI